ncbi:Wbp1p [Sugiyamaella lignohabitans]|uniref:Dolichyl-diphosphooligosaccharide--protein glycosyltransferase subunit WBP1 n=1 Tax=Sugiyamaella lignohabitans TaxID=796027 RepID=A0A167FQS6_9ASCO|nr:Wbp1p [Sugiyamaella lignohabitans]ANB15578.1 Wbp1p [Sugiyamaella lignohabitans]
MYFCQWLLTAGIAALSLGAGFAKPLNGAGRTLVVVDDPNEYSQYLESLEQREFQLTIKDTHDESGLELVNYGELTYDNLIVLPTKAKSLGPKLSAKALLEYFNLGGNILAVTSAKSSPESLREFAAELDIHISPRGYQIVDHFNSADSSDEHNVLKLTSANINAPDSVISDIISHDEDGGSTKSGEFDYEAGNAAYLGNNELVIPFISAPSTSYVFDAREQEDNDVADKLWVSGSQAYLAAGLQSRKNTRFSWVGSASLFKNGAAASASAIDNITKWTFQEKSVLKSVGASHYDLTFPEVENPHIYKVSTDVLYLISLSEWNGNEWVPFDASDVQLEFIMLDPYYRLTLSRNATAEAAAEDGSIAIYSTQFKAPDQYGMFTFKTEYQRPGYTFVEDARVVTVRHIANDEWPRSWEITNSWVYLTSAGSVVIGWLVFVAFYLYTGYSPKKSDKKTQ